jgi:serpin B
MKAAKCIFIVLAAVTVGPHCFGSDMPAPQENSDKEVIMRGNNGFALELYAKLRDSKGNLFFSPYSISTALAMTYAGARGRTETEMADVLHFPTAAGKIEPEPNHDPIKSTRQILSRRRFHSAFGNIIKDLNARGEKGSYELTVANALWGQKGYGFLKAFLELINAHYGGGLNEVDFVGATERARKTINAWVEKETNDKIKDLIQPGVLDSMTRLVLTNAVYFKGNWARQFDKVRTMQAPFTLANGQKQDVAMMNQTAEFKYTETESLQVLELPYVDDELSMIILLPKKLDGLNELEETLTLEKLLKWQAKLRKREVFVSVPRFKMTSQFGLAGVLKSMGMREAFSTRADFSGMNGKKDLFISAVIHKAYVDVNEEGTEAAAATAVTMTLTAVAPSPTPVFWADHPFLFLIRDNDCGSILFLGRVMNPKE